VIASRRRFLAGGLRAAGLAGLGALACDSDRPGRGFLGLMERANERFQRALFDPRRLAPELGEEALSPPGAFPQYKIGDAFPDVPAGWSLAVRGLVRRPMALSLADLRRLPRTDVRVRHHCVEGWSAVAGWNGVRLSELARLVEPDPRARYVEFRSFEPGYHSSWDLESALHPQTILAYGMNGRELPIAHGAPLRVRVETQLGYKSMKFLRGLVVTSEFDDNGPYGMIQNGYSWYAGI
jgi:DMSO/TMAO reductase YedYZ molybdopterin-dependent catalytic subunit